MAWRRVGLMLCAALAGGLTALAPLEQAVQALAGLTEGNRLVGIISHVAELKERIDRQIVVTKERIGGSRAEIRS